MNQTAGRTSPGVTIVCDPSGWGGAEAHTISLARTLAARGHRVTVALLSNAVTAQFMAAAGDDFAVILLNPTPGRDPGVRVWRKRFQSLSGDIGILAKNWFYTGSLGLDLIARESFRRYLVIEHLTPPPPPRRSHGRHLGGLLPGVGAWWYREMAIIRLRSRAPARVFTVSEAIRRGLVDDYGYPEERVRTIHNGVDVTRFAPSAAARAATRAAWGVTDDVTVFGAVGRLDTGHKGLDLAIEAFRRFLERIPEAAARLVLVGEGPDRDALLEQAETAGIASRVFLAGRTESPELAYPAIDIQLMPSRVEGLPLSLMEGMATTCVPIAARVSGIPEIINDPRLGWLVDREDTAGLAVAMTEAFEMPAEERRSMGARARERIVGNFAADNQFTELAKAIEKE